MIDIVTFQENIKKNIISNCYVFCGNDEQTIKDSIISLVSKFVDKEFIDLNYMQFDGNSLENFEPVINACQTLPFMSDKKVVLVYRASFIEDDKGDNGKISGDKDFNKISEYIGEVPSHCILILYDVFKGKRDKPGKRINKLSKNACVVKADKLRGQQLENKIKSLFDVRNKQIGRIELKAFCSLMDENNLSVIENEVEKLCCFTNEQEITKEDIKELFLKSNDDDIFDLVNPISNKRLNESLEVLNELIYRGEKINYILSMIERQFNLLFKVKIGIEARKSKTDIMKEINTRSDYAYDMFVSQSKKFTLKQLHRAIELCIKAEQKMKSSSVDEKTELELLIINSIAG
ncbi:DNA polymerase III subunit delta [Clostridium thailandense]|uniref:DNA polymerase III subunit delta n=1 Tax=Clostridium thailandense TaxID=2794346 RepID=UPI003989E2F5